MQLHTSPTDLPKPRRARQLIAASIAYLTTVCASVAAAAALVTESVPVLLVTGL